MGPAQPRYYPQIARRIQALVIDSIIFIIVFMACALTLSRIDIHGGYKAAIVVSILFFLEPFLVSKIGGTIGHRMKKLRIIDTNTGGNIGVMRATIRILARFLLGIFSLIFILTSRQRQALHDMMTGTTVILCDTAGLAQNEVFEETVIEETGYIYPSPLRRILVIVAYNSSLLVIMSAAGAILLLEQCISAISISACSFEEKVIHLVISVTWFILLATTIVLGWKARLWGCRRKITPSGNATVA